MHKLLSLALFAGGLLVGGVIVWLMWLYVMEGRLAVSTAVVAAVFGLALLSLPQFILGVYLLRAN